jgi:hypothetical protein
MYGQELTYHHFNDERRAISILASLIRCIASCGLVN